VDLLTVLLLARTPLGWLPSVSSKVHALHPSAVIRTGFGPVEIPYPSTGHRDPYELAKAPNRRAIRRQKCELFTGTGVSLRCSGLSTTTFDNAIFMLLFSTSRAK
jgi:hypothetical protein